MQSAKPRHQDSFVPMYHNYSRLVASIAANFPLTPQQQEEVCQDVFLVVWQRKQQLVHEYALASWLGTITRHRCLSVLRRNKAMISLEELTEDHLHAQQANLVPPQTETQLWHLELSLNLLHKLIDEHSSPVRRCVARRFYTDGESVASIAEALHMCPNTVLSHLRRFRLIVQKSLLRMLDERGIDLISA